MSLCLPLFFLFNQPCVSLDQADAVLSFTAGTLKKTCKLLPGDERCSRNFMVSGFIVHKVGVFQPEEELSDNTLTRIFR